MPLSSSFAASLTHWRRRKCLGRCGGQGFVLDRNDLLAPRRQMQKADWQWSYVGRGVEWMHRVLSTRRTVLLRRPYNVGELHDGFMTAHCATAGPLFAGAKEIIVEHCKTTERIDPWYILRQAPNVTAINIVCHSEVIGHDPDVPLFRPPTFDALVRLTVDEGHRYASAPAFSTTHQSECATASILIRAPNLSTFRTNRFPAGDVCQALRRSGAALILDCASTTQLATAHVRQEDLNVRKMTFLARGYGWRYDAARKFNPIDTLCYTAHTVQELTLICPRPHRIDVNYLRDFFSGRANNLIVLNLGTHGAQNAGSENVGISLHFLEVFAARLPKLEELSILITDVVIRERPRERFLHLRRLNVGDTPLVPTVIQTTAKFLREITVVRPFTLGMCCDAAVEEGFLTEPEAVLTGGWAEVAQCIEQW